VALAAARYDVPAPELHPLIIRDAREALRWVGHLPTRSRGTIGGSIAHADPAAELPLILVTCGGSVRVEGHAGSRMIAADALFESMFTTRIAADEILTENLVPVIRGHVEPLTPGAVIEVLGPD
jgi:carbon-monoxide dehydrogenase medium subunit